ncbi:MAG: hypothetical protein ACTSVV_15290 [Promethearchaeota archaeon]
MDQDIKEINQFILNFDNPFENFVVREMTDDVIDVKNIYKLETDEIRNTINEIDSDEKSKIIVLLGEAGSGKTHFLSRLRKLSLKDSSFNFIGIKTITDISNIYKEILKSIIKTFKLNYRNENLIIEKLIYDIICDLETFVKQHNRYKKIQKYIKKIQKNPDKFFKMKYKRNIKVLNDIKDILKINKPELHSHTLNIIFEILNPENKWLCLDWLNCINLTEDDLKKLNVGYYIETDDEALPILQTISLLIKRPILLCIDQLESVDEYFREYRGIEKLFTVLMDLRDKFKKILVLIMCQAHIWPSFVNKISKAMEDRLDKIISFTNPNYEDLYKIIELRLLNFYQTIGKEPPYKTYPFKVEYINWAIRDSEIKLPRSILKHFSILFNEFKKNKQVKEYYPPTLEEEIDEKEKDIKIIGESIGEIDVEDIPLEQFIKNEKKEFLDEFDLRLLELNPEDFENDIKLSLYYLLKRLQDFEIPLFEYKISQVNYSPDSKRSINLIFTLESDSINYNVNIEINNSKNANSVSSTINRLIRKNEGESNSFSFILRDEKLQIPNSWKKTTENLKTLRKNGEIIYVDKDSLRILIFFKKFIDKLSAGELKYPQDKLNKKEVISIIVDDFKENKLLKKLFKRINQNKNDKKTDFNDEVNGKLTDNSISEDQIELIPLMNKALEFIKEDNLLDLEILANKMEITKIQCYKIVKILERENKVIVNERNGEQNIIVLLKN